MKHEDRNLLLLEAARLLKENRLHEQFNDELREWLILGLRAEAEGRPWPFIDGRGHGVSHYSLSLAMVEEMERRGYSASDVDLTRLGDEDVRYSLKANRKANQNIYTCAIKSVAANYEVTEKTVRNALKAKITISANLEGRSHQFLATLRFRIFSETSREK